MDLIAGMNAAISAAKVAQDFVKGNREAQNEIINLRQQLLDLIQECMNIIQQNNDLQMRLREAEEKLRLDEVVFYQDEACWRKDKEGQENGPYCHVCWENDRKLFHLSKDGGSWYCFNCQNYFVAKSALTD